MKIKIRKGTNQIGGCITSIESKEACILIDFGEDLKPTHIQIEGIYDYDAVFITHIHMDHIGLISKIPKAIPIYIEADSKIIYEIMQEFMKKKHKQNTIIPFSFNQPISIKDITITPFLTDHSAYHSVMYLITTEGKRILHMGDFRNHGRVKEAFQKNISQLKEIDVLITEGTSFSRKDHLYQTEWELEQRAIQYMKEYDQVFLLQSSTNIDRLVSFYRASLQTKKNFIEDLFTATITSHLNKKIPNPKTFSNVSIWIPSIYRKKSFSFKKKYINPMKQYQNSHVLQKNYTMMVKTSMLEDLSMLKKKGYITNACLIYSMWDGYKEQDEMQTFLKNIKKLGINIYRLHTSGHADLETMKWLNDVVKPKLVIPIHTIKKEKAKELFDRVLLLEDEEEVVI